MSERLHFRKRPVVVEASRWYRNGDHPDDWSVPIRGMEPGVSLTEGRVVRYYRRPDDSGVRLCEHCAIAMHNHGWIDTMEGGHIVCPGDWIIVGVKGERYPCKPDVFAATYEQVETMGAGVLNG